MGKCVNPGGSGRIRDGILATMILLAQQVIEHSFLPGRETKAQGRGIGRGSWAFALFYPLRTTASLGSEIQLERIIVQRLELRVLPFGIL